jgi:hypothetical protein
MVHAFRVIMHNCDYEDRLSGEEYGSRVLGHNAYILKNHVNHRMSAAKPLIYANRLFA